MNLVDLVVLILLLLSAVLGFVNGLVCEVLGVGAWIGAILIAFAAYPMLEPLMHRLIANQNLVGPASFGVVALVALIILWIVSRLLARVVRGSILSGLDRTLGIFFGLVRGAALLIVAYILGGSLFPADQWSPEIRNARTLPYIYRGAVWGLEFEPATWPHPQLQVPPGIDAPATAAAAA